MPTWLIPAYVVVTLLLSATFGGYFHPVLYGVVVTLFLLVTFYFYFHLVKMGIKKKFSIHFLPFLLIGLVSLSVWENYPTWTTQPVQEPLLIRVALTDPIQPTPVDWWFVALLIGGLFVLIAIGWNIYKTATIALLEHKAKVATIKGDIALSRFPPGTRASAVFEQQKSELLAEELRIRSNAKWDEAKKALEIAKLTAKYELEIEKIRKGESSDDKR